MPSYDRGFCITNFFLKNQETENILNLSPKQIESVLDYIMEEAIATSSLGNRSTTLTNRVELLITCTKTDEKLTKLIVEYAQNKMSDRSVYRPACVSK